MLVKMKPKCSKHENDDADIWRELFCNADPARIMDFWNEQKDEYDGEVLEFMHSVRSIIQDPDLNGLEFFILNMFESWFGANHYDAIRCCNLAKIIYEIALAAKSTLE